MAGHPRRRGGADSSLRRFFDGGQWLDRLPTDARGVESIRRRGRGPTVPRRYRLGLTTVSGDAPRSPLHRDLRMRWTPGVALERGALARPSTDPKRGAVKRSTRTPRRRACARCARRLNMSRRAAMGKRQIHASDLANAEWGPVAGPRHGPPRGAVRSRVPHRRARRGAARGRRRRRCWRGRRARE